MNEQFLAPIVNPIYFIVLTFSILSPFRQIFNLHNLLLLLKTMHFVFLVLICSFQFSQYSLSLFNFICRSSSEFSNKTRSSAYITAFIFSPSFIMIGLLLLLSITENILKRRGLSGHPCRTPLVRLKNFIIIF